MEACGSAHHWARVIGHYGHEVRLMPPAYVKPYVKRNKNDGRDAEAICEAVSRPSMRFVPVKSVEQQAALAVHGTRALMVRQRTMAANALRAALTELGIVAAKGLEGLRELMAGLEKPSAEIPEIMRSALLMLAKHWQALDAAERVLEQADSKGSSLRSGGSPADGGAGRRPDHRQHDLGQGCLMLKCSAPDAISQPGSG
jgi:transposase